MTRKIIALLLLVAGTGVLRGQDKQFGRKALEADVDYLQRQLKEVHADPLRELDEKKWQALFNGMRAQLKDSMTQAAFFAVVKPAVAYLSDEHADITTPGYFGQHAVFPPFSLRAAGKDFVWEGINGVTLEPNQKVLAVNGVAVAALVNELSRYTTGFPEERHEKALEQFGYLYGMSHPFETKWTVTLTDHKEIQVAPATLQNWVDQLKRMNGTGGPKQRMRYETFGNIGYFTVPDFSVRSDADEEMYRRTIDSVFEQAIKNGIKHFVIDVSHNSGGNSIVGTMMIDHFYTKPYKSYQMNWRRSNDYLALMKSWGSSNPEYEALQPGQVLHRDASTVTPATDVPKFKGKVYVVIGNGTFSSAIMFATIVKDNKMATLIGQAPKGGHPSHFGELYSTRLPNTQLALRFGVKEWIRPLGNKIKNVLTPEVGLEKVEVSEVVGRIRGEKL